jgi:hypothetical protein
MRRTIFLRRGIFRSCKAKKEGRWKTRALISVKVNNLQRGTANAVELGGKATMCISYVRYGGLMGKRQPSFVHASHAHNA